MKYQQIDLKNRVIGELKLLIVRKYFLPVVHRKLALLVSFCVRKIKTNIKLYRTSGGKSTFRTQNDTDSANFRYRENKKYRSYHVRKYAFPHLMRNILYFSGLRFKKKKNLHKWNIKSKNFGISVIRKFI